MADDVNNVTKSSMRNSTPHAFIFHLPQKAVQAYTSMLFLQKKHRKTFIPVTTTLGKKKERVLSRNLISSTMYDMNKIRSHPAR